MCLLPIAATQLPTVSAIPTQVWLLLAVTGLFQAIYYCGLAGAYRSGHLSVAYPLARSAPVIFVAVVSVLLGRQGELTTVAIIGMALVAAGSLALPVGRISDWKVRDYIHPASLFALVAAVGTTGYSMVDDAALRLLRSSADAHGGRIILTLVYAFFEGLSATLWMGLIVLLGRRHQDGKRPPNRFASAALAGVGITFAYALVLLAMTFAKNVSYIVAFRQLSIPIGAALGMTVLREPRNTMKLIGISVMLVGLVLVAVK